MRFTSATLTCLVASACLALAPSPAGAATAPTTAGPPSCHGHRATIVGVPGKPTRGTPHRDVIVTNGSGTIDAGGGDDQICVTGKVPNHAAVIVQAGDGDDRIDATASRSQVTAYLGPGDDRFLGSPLSDFVSARGGGRDAVFTLGGDDQVDAGGLHGHHDQDLVHLGPGNDVMSGTLDPSTRWFGDRGTDTANLASDGYAGRTHPADYLFDASRHATYRNGKVVQRYTGFEGYVIGNLYARHVGFLGTDASESVSLVVRAALGSIHVDLGAGDDYATIALTALQTKGTTIDLDGGGGVDGFDAYGRYTSYDGNAPQSLTGDLATGTFTAVHAKSTITGTLSGVENLEAFAYPTVTLTGDAHDNVLTAPRTCRGTFTGGAGNDTLMAAEPFNSTCRMTSASGVVTNPGATLDGGPGDDTMIGGAGDDHLTGDAGTDSADGGDGTDVCDAESEVRCES